jgi:hypothetical protein
VESDGQVRIIATSEGNKLSVIPADEQVLSEEMELAVMGRTAGDLAAFAEQGKLEVSSDLGKFTDVLSSDSAGVAEVVIPPDSSLIGKSCEEAWMSRM